MLAVTFAPLRSRNATLLVRILPTVNVFAGSVGESSAMMQRLLSATGGCHVGISRRFTNTLKLALVTLPLLSVAVQVTVLVLIWPVKVKFVDRKSKSLNSSH